jgi:hypothetical protein
MGTRARHTLVAIFLLAAATLPAQATRGLRVLFIGNSLTAGNDVPSLVQAMAQLQGVSLQVATVAPGGYAIEDHWRDGNQRLLESGNYDLVVLQQGPSTLPASQANLREWSVTWASFARRLGVRTALYMIWPVRGQDDGFGLVSRSYRNAAIAAEAGIFPAGEAWQQALRLRPSIELYQSDDLHATPAGSFLAAMVIARGLFALDPARVPASVRGVSVSADTLATFRGVVESMPPSTLSATDSEVAPPVPDTPTAETTPSPPTATSPAAPATSAIASGGGGGGAPSVWFLLALLALAITRRGQRSPGRL